MIYRLYEHLLQSRIRKGNLPGCVAVVLSSGDLLDDGLLRLGQMLEWSLSIGLTSLVLYVNDDAPVFRRKIASLLKAAPAQISLHTAEGVEQTGAGGPLKVVISLGYGGKREVTEAFRALLKDVEREDIARMVIGLMVLLLPFAGAFTVIPLAAVFFLDRGSRLLTASLAMLLIMRPALVLTDTNLPQYVIAISFVASTFAPLAFRKFDSLAGSIMYLLINVGLGYPVASLISGGSISSERILFLVILGGLSGTRAKMQISRMRCSSGSG